MAPRDMLTFHTLIGVTEIDAADGRSTVTVKGSADLGNRRGDVHGGALAAYLDIAMSRALHTAIADDASIATISMTVNYLEPARGNLAVHGEVVRAGGTIAVLHGTVVDERGVTAADASGVFRILNKR